MLKKFYPVWQALRFRGACFLYAKKLLEGISAWKVKTNVYSGILPRYSGLKTVIRSEKSVQIRYPIFAFEPMKNWIWEYILWSRIKSAFSRVYILQNLPKYIPLWQILQKKTTRCITFVSIFHSRGQENTNISTEAEKVPIRLKMTLTVKEAAAYSNIGINKIERVLRTPNCPFVLYVGSKKLVKRKDFEEYIRKNLII